MTTEPGGLEELSLSETSLVDDQALEEAAATPPDGAHAVGEGTIDLANGEAPPSPGADASPTATVPPPSATPARDRWAGKRVGHFRLTRLLGSGVMGVVFQAEDISLKRVVALKLLRRRIEGVSERDRVAWFLHEAQVIASIDHQNIAQIYEINQHGAWWYIAMEFMEGGSVQNLLDATGPLEPTHACAILADAARGLAEAHAAGLVHRDVKPSNLMLTRRGRCKLVDFGVAGAPGSTPGISPGASSGKGPGNGHLVGTPLYIAPEAIERRPALPASDVYSFAATMFVTLTGRHVFTGKTVEDIFRQHREATPPDAREFAPKVSEGLARLIGWSLAKDPGQRPRAAALVAALQVEVAALASHHEAMGAATGARHRADAPAPHRSDVPAAAGRTGVITIAAPLEAGAPGAGGAVRLRARRAVPWRSSLRVAVVLLVLVALLGSLMLVRAANLMGKPSAPAIVNNSVGMRLVLVPAGDFTMGSPPDEPGRDVDERQFRVHISKPFYMGATTVTRGQWREVMGAGYVSAEGVHPDDLSGARFVGDSLPMVDVSWIEAELFCQRLSAAESVTYRLPTEAEWEYACRAGTTTAFAFGPTLDRHVANIEPPALESASSGASSGQTSGSVAGPITEELMRPMPVGSFPPNAWGLYDMHGNAMEWCSDVYGEYPLGSAIDPQGRHKMDPGEPVARVVRGGSWLHSAAIARSASRWSYSPVIKSQYIGFRVVREVPE